MGIKQLIASMPPFKQLFDDRNRYFDRMVALESREQALLQQCENQKHTTIEYASRIQYLENAVDDATTLIGKRSFQDIPSFLRTTNEMIDHSFLYLNEDHSIVGLIPIELLYTEAWSPENGSSNVVNMTDAWLMHHLENDDKMLIKLIPHRELFRFFIDGSVSPASYLYWYNQLFETRNMPAELTPSALMEKRYNEYIFMQNQLSTHGLRFFIDTPVRVSWNPNGYFNVLDGHHRSVFLIESGLKYVPALMRLEDYLTWRNDKLAISFSAFIKESPPKDGFYTAIHNPFFMQLSVYRDDENRSRLFLIMQALKDVDLSGMSVLDIGSNIGYISRHFCREGAKVVSLEPHLHYALISEKLQTLCYTKHSVLRVGFENFESDHQFDIGILLTVFYHFMPNAAVRDQFIDNLNKYISRMLIWESGDQPAQEKEYILAHTRFKNYHFIAHTYGTGKIRELGIFSV